MLTIKQEELYGAIKDFIKENGYAPTVRELTRIINKKSPATTYNLMQQLIKKGYISTDGKARTIKVIK